MDLAETDENENGNENEKGNGRQESYRCGIGRRSCKPTFIVQDSVVHPETCHRLKTGCSFELYINAVAIDPAAGRSLPTL